MMRILLVGGCALALVACSGKSADEKAMQNAELANYTPPFVMSRLDFGGVIERRFRRLDTNNDDKLEPSEIAPKNRERVMSYDTNKDGFVSVEEWGRGMLARFDAQDLNHDGTVTSDERERAREMNDSDLPTPADEPANATAAAGRAAAR
ncbi:hypothetical protein KZ810_14830 [Sphingomonas sp. RHCKR47]|nr:hypothetical protein [Sphingomonas citricola]